MCNMSVNRGSRKASSRYSSRRRKCDDGEFIVATPPLEVLDRIPGYENVSFETVSIPPPEYVEDSDLLDPEHPMLGTWTPEPQNVIKTGMPQMSESVARTALIAYVKNHCCWGAGVAKHMSVTAIRYTHAYHYVLHSFTEKREARWAWSPHVGGEIDGPEVGQAPSAWDITAFPSKPFQAEIKALEVPHTSSIKPCHRCRGAGTIHCPPCNGKGWTRCLTCQGEGYGIGSDRDRCIMCGSSVHGHGRQDCSRCGAKGKVACPTCESYGQLKCFIQLTVSWKVSVGEHVTGAEDLPPDLIRQAEGEIPIEATGVKLEPLSSEIIGDETVALASSQLIQDHVKNSLEALLLAQRHQIRIVPVTIVDYKWKNHQGNFFIYGLENKVFAPDYPQTCCCGCAIV